MPNYFFNYGPIIFVMIANPIIYVQCSKEVDQQLIRRFGQYTNNERQVHDLFKIKFSLINVIFYVCWLPNIINAICMWTNWMQISRIRSVGLVVIVNWYIIAALNPLQAFFNAFIYRKWNQGVCGGCGSIRNWFSGVFSRRISVNYTSQVITETSPLLLASTSSMTTQSKYNLERKKSDEEIQVEVDNFHKHSIQCPLI